MALPTKKIETAGDARQLAQANLKGPVIKPWVDYILAVVTAAAREGRFSFTHVFRDRRSDVGYSAPEYPNSDMQSAIKREIERLGFKWIEHPDPDPGHPASGPYNEISWREA